MRLKNKKIYNWPPLPYEKWKDTLNTLHMYMQIVGKIKLELCPFINQWWEVAFQITPTGMTTGRIPYHNKVFDIDFDFITHRLIIKINNGSTKIIGFKSISVANFYNLLTSALESLSIRISINTMPVEFANPIPFEKDNKHATYNKEYVRKWWQIQLQLAIIFDRFRSDFRGKSSPIHFFWGSFDLSGTRFSGRKAIPPHQKGYMGRIMKYAENEENFAFGFWPGDVRFPNPAFYSYIYPAPKGIEKIKLGNAFFENNLSEFILPYDEVIKQKYPENIINDFLDSSYHKFAQLSGWNIKDLKQYPPKIA